MTGRTYPRETAGGFARDTAGGFARESAGTVLVARLDNAGDAPRQGPLARAAAPGSDAGGFLASPQRPAAAAVPAAVHPVMT